MKRNQLVFAAVVFTLYCIFIAMSLFGGWSMPGMTGWWGFGSINRIAIFFMWLAPFALLMAFVLFAMWVGKKEQPSLRDCPFCGAKKLTFGWQACPYCGTRLPPVEDED